MYGGLVLLGIHDHCTPGLVASVSAWSALLSSFAEVQQVLVEQGVKLDVKVVRKLAYRYAERARVVQQAGQISLAEGDTVQGRRVVVSADGSLLRLRENKRGAKTKKGRNRYRGAWREPKLLIIYVVDVRGKEVAHRQEWWWWEVSILARPEGWALLYCPNDRQHKIF